MRRADRLFQIVQILRRRRSVTTARHLAQRLEVSDRTIYRDVNDLLASGVPIEGEAGVGYMLREYDLPPLMFSREEIEALVLGARIVQSWTDPDLARDARAALDKIGAVLPEDLEHYIEGAALIAPRDHFQERVNVPFADIRRALRESRKLAIEYIDEHNNPTRRVIQPLWLAFYGPVWLLVAWCELRSDYRAFRPDRIQTLELRADTFARRPTDALPPWIADVRYP